MKPQMAFISPVAPDANGLGRQIRAWLWLQRWTRTHDITLILPDQEPVAPEVLRAVRRCIRIPRLSRWQRVKARARSLIPNGGGRRSMRHAPNPALRIAAMDHEPPLQFDVVFVFRLYMLPIAEVLPKSAPRGKIWLDLDDFESLTFRRIASVARGRHWYRTAWRNGRWARHAENTERAHLPRMDRVFVCSDEDRARLMDAGLYPDPEVFPNRYCGPLRQMEQVVSSTVLFVGSLGYLPNQDAVLWFAQEILPAVNRTGPERITFQVAGAGLSRHLADQLRRIPDVEVKGFVDDLAPLYRDAALVVCPIRAGGGTRIKILEAAAMGRCVVSTSLGMEGLGFESDEIEVANEPQAFAEAVRILTKDLDRRRMMARKAARRLRENYWYPPDSWGG
jgi:polysaccharide biosynthesis protein PslH